MYGITENTIHSTYYKLDKQIIKNSNTSIIGTTIPNWSIYILNNSQNILPKGAIETLYMGGIGLARGYLNNKKLTNQKFIPNPYQTKDQKQLNLNDKIYNSGDLARINKYNQIEFIGRKDDQVKIRGFRIELKEIEQVVQSYSKIDKAIAITKDNQIVLYYMSNKSSVGKTGDSSHPTNALNATDIRNHLQLKLPDYMIPSFIIPIIKIPLTQNGKLNKKVLPSIDTINKDKQIIKPISSLETQLLDIFSQTLNIDKQKISTVDNFFHLGGDSIKAIIVVNLINNTAVKIRKFLIYTPF
jgi:acyl-CoA synthetase (AMP-forming)/AMP-acid ligase II